jgi:hypothetical protein
MKEVAVLNPVWVRGALAASKGLTVLVECILDEFDKSELLFTAVIRGSAVLIYRWFWTGAGSRLRWSPTSIGRDQ